MANKKQSKNKKAKNISKSRKNKNSKSLKLKPSNPTILSGKNFLINSGVAKNFKNKKYYFTKKVEDAIIEYNNLDKIKDKDRREYLFNTIIKKALEKLCENIYNRFFRSNYLDDNYTNIKNDLLSFLVLNLSKYNSKKGKAFSYFSIIAKNYLILNNKYGYDKAKAFNYLNPVDKVNNNNLSSQEEDNKLKINNNELDADDKLYKYYFDESYIDYKDFNNQFIQLLENNIDKLFKKQSEKEILEAFIFILKNAESVNIYSKKGVYFMIRELLGDYEDKISVKTYNISKIINKVKKYYLKAFKKYIENGYINVNSYLFL